MKTRVADKLHPLADRKTAIRVLNDVLASWCVCVLQHKRHYHLASGMHARIETHSGYAEGRSLLGMIRQDLLAERNAVESYTEIIRYLGDHDATTCTMMGKILCKGEEHAEEMNLMLESLYTDVHVEACA